MDLKRRIAISAALLAVALGAGQVLKGPGAELQDQAALVPDPVPTAIVPLVANVQAPLPPAARHAPILPALPEAPYTQAKLTLPPKALVPLILAPPPPMLAAAPDPVPQGTEAPCVVQLDLAAQPSAMLRLGLLAACHADERVVVRHAGLAVTAKTSANGALVLSLPALTRDASVSVLFADGETAEAQLDVPGMADARRFAVQWLADDAFQVHAFEGEADYGTPGDVSATNPHQPLPGVPASGGFLTLLGDASVDLPMQAEVYTYPAAPGAMVRVVVEAAVTPRTCDRELLGETLFSQGGQVTATDLTVAMPGCDAIGDILVLKNLAPDMKIAAN